MDKKIYAKELYSFNYKKKNISILETLNFSKYNFNGHNFYMIRPSK